MPSREWELASASFRLLPSPSHALSVASPRSPEQIAPDVQPGVAIALKRAHYVLLLALRLSACLHVVCWCRPVSGSSRLHRSARCRLLLFKTNRSCSTATRCQSKCKASSSPLCVSPCRSSFSLLAYCLLVPSREWKLAVAPFRSLPSPPFKTNHPCIAATRHSSGPSVFLLAGRPFVCLHIVCWCRLVAGRSRLHPSARCRRLLLKTNHSCIATSATRTGLVCVSPCGSSFGLLGHCLLAPSREWKLAAAPFRSLPSPPFKNRLLLHCSHAPLERG